MALDPLHAKIDEFVEKSKALIGKEISEREYWNTTATQDAIRHFAYGISDDNPLWLDPLYASKSHAGRQLAPPTFLTSILYPHLHGEPMEVPLSNLIGDLDFQWFSPIFLGDYFRASAKITGVYESKNREGRRLVYIVSETCYWNQHDVMVGMASGTMVKYALPENELLLNRAIYHYTEEELQRIGEAQACEYRRGQGSWANEDFEIGQELPTLVRGPLTVGDLICWQAGIGPSYRPGSLGYLDNLKAPHNAVKNPVTHWPVKYSQQHEDFLLASQRGMPAPFDNGVMRLAWISPMLTNWIGDSGTLKRLSIQILEPNLYGDTTWYRGVVGGKLRNTQGTLLKINVSGINQLKMVTTKGTAEVFVPFEQIKKCQSGPHLTRQDLPHSQETTPQVIYQQFESQAQKTPDALALSFEHEGLTYGALNQRANQLAHHLRSLGVGPEVSVGILMERSMDVVVAILAILKAGGAYIYFDPEYPVQRVTVMLEDAQVLILLTQEQLKTRLPQYPPTIVIVDSIQNFPTKRNGNNPVNICCNENLAYLMYTSGSTTQPKIVGVPHISLCTYINILKQSLKVGPEDIFLQTASFAFSASTRQIFLPLCLGATVQIVNTEQRQNPGLLYKDICTRQVTVWDTVPSVWHNCAETVFGLERSQRAYPIHNSLRLILLTGEALNGKTFKLWKDRLNDNTTIVNLYSQTESAGTVSSYSVSHGWDNRTGSVPLGDPLPGRTVHVLDKNLRLVEAQESGHIFVGGEPMSRGYFNQPALTSERFIPDPFGQGPGGRILDTGDLARYQLDGSLEWIGRSDQQVKLRGFRVELGEIETILRQHEETSEVIVVPRENGQGDQRLVAYLVLHRDQFVTVEELRMFLLERLPTFMVPAAFVFLEAMPFLPNGKIDRNSLPEVVIVQPDLEEREGEPRNPLELKIARIWAEVLGLDRISIHHNFFELGGHSLLASKVLARMNETFNVALSFRNLFEHPTIADLVPCLNCHHVDQPTPRLQARPRDNALPLSFAQQRLWFLDQWEPGNRAYLLTQAWRLQGPLDITALQASLTALVARHETLRTVFVEKNGIPTQVIRNEVDVSMTRIDLSSGDPQTRRQQASQIASTDAHRPFDLTTGPLWRIHLLRLDAEEYILLLTLHHIITDLWSMDILFRELSTFYSAQVTGQPAALPPLPLQYADFAIWQRQCLQEKDLERQLNYWRTQLAGALPGWEAPTDFPRPPQPTHRGERLTFTLPVSLTQALQTFSQQEGGTLFMTLLAAFQVLLFRYAGQRDILVGAPIAGRTHSDLEGLIGFFVNTLVIRTQFKGKPTFRAVLQQVRNICLDAYTHQDVPFEKLVEALQPTRDPSRHPFFQIMFQLFSQPDAAPSFPGLHITPEPICHQRAKFDLNCTLRETAGILHGTMEYSTDIFVLETIQRLVGHYEQLLEGIVDNPDQQITTLPLLPKAEAQQQLLEWNETAQAYPFTKCIHELIEEQVEKTPDAVAIVFEQKALTYDAFNRKANQLAHHLQRLGVGPEKIVAIAMERSLNLMVGLLGILKAGGTYLPLAINSPNDRLAYMLDHSRVSLLLTQQHDCAHPPTEGIQIICLDTNGSVISRESGINPRSSVVPDNPAYIIYTSGSTGRPKGVVITHRGLVNYLAWFTSTYPVGEGLETLVHSSIGFDLTVTSLFAPLLAGGSVRLIDESAGLEEIVAALRLYGSFGLLKMTPSHLEGINQLLQPQDILERIGTLFLGGETLVAQTLAGWNSYGKWPKIVNEYGPTETVVGCCAYEVSQGNSFSGSIPIGRPISNMQIYLLDQYLQPRPIGIPAEVHIGGVGLARGYHKRPDLTAEQFIPHPLSKEPNARLYKTGDLARYRPDGTIEYGGRLDHQVKIRGFRIELGEIETVLGQHPDVLQAVVLCREDFPGTKQLVGYIVPRETQNPSTDDLLILLRRRLPEYMVPSIFVFLEALPLTHNGKVNRMALPPPDQTPQVRAAAYVAPRTPLEAAVGEIWCDLLKEDDISVHDNFFSLGGHSLLATQVVARLRHLLEMDLPLRTLFEHPTVAELAREIDCKLTKTFADWPLNESEDPDTNDS
ncbi:MAG: amino acid adenylation domain-containing protein [Nitrospira sp.]|nr:amino acid adenylation domain-containing protein [Nitrospira sp.]